MSVWALRTALLGDGALRCVRETNLRAKLDNPPRTRQQARVPSRVGGHLLS